MVDSNPVPTSSRVSHTAIVNSGKLVIRERSQPFQHWMSSKDLADLAYQDFLDHTSFGGTQLLSGNATGRT